MTALDWQPLANALAATLEADGALHEPAWRRAFTAIPRHLFAPFFLEQFNGAEHVVDSADPAQRDHWLERVYSDKPDHANQSFRRRRARLPTTHQLIEYAEHHGVDARSARPRRRPAGVGDRHRYRLQRRPTVHRLGDANVASIDIDPALVEQARQRLAILGYAPTLAAGDGAAGLVNAAPYDAILATAAVDHIPPAWIEQLRTGGVIVADLRGGFSGAMIRLCKIDDDTVEGRCQNYDAAFMPMRRELSYPLRQGVSSPLVMDRRNPQRGTTNTDPRMVADSRGLRFLVELQLAGTHFDLFVGGNEVVVTAIDGSWAAATLAADVDGTYAVAQAGPRRLWDSVEAAVTAWDHAGNRTSTPSASPPMPTVTINACGSATRDGPTRGHSRFDRLTRALIHRDSRWRVTVTRDGREHSGTHRPATG